MKKQTLESLKSSKFEAFKGMQVSNPLMVLGGRSIGTTYTTTCGGAQTGGGNDTEYWNCEQVDITGANGTHTDPSGKKWPSDTHNTAMGTPVPDPGLPPDCTCDIVYIGPEME